MESTTEKIDDDALFAELRDATAGLLYASESDEPFRVFVWKSTEADAAKQIAAMGKWVEPLDEISPAKFFASLVAGDDAGRYLAVRRILESNLTGLRVIRLGEIEIDIWLIGKTTSGSWAGLQTHSVET